MASLCYSGFSIYPRETKAKDVDYDRIVFDTYDYLDKLIGFRLSDIFYAAFHQYFLRTGDVRARKLSNYFRYGTDDDKEIWLLRYGFAFEDIEWLRDYVLSINEKEILFSNDIQSLPDENKKLVERYMYA